jgi:hypothetical protein
MKRVVILGRGASLKSTLALHLAEITGLKPNAIPWGLFGFVAESVFSRSVFSRSAKWNASGLGRAARRELFLR